MIIWEHSDSSSNQLSNVNSYPISGIYRPQHLLSSFDNLGASGYWTLRIINSGSVRTGVIKSWGITLSYSPLPVTSWQLISTHTLVNEEWRDVYFTDVNNFWGCGNSNGVGSIYRSTNGGLNWNIAYRDSSNYNSIKSIYFINSSTGFACGDGGMIYSTFNGGQNWSPQYITGSTNLRCIRFLNSSTGLVCGGDNLPEIYKTTNGGLSWFGGITSGVSFLECICFADANTAYAGGDWDILKSIDGGNTWSILITQGSVYRGEFPSIQFLNANTGYVAAGRDGVLYTSNGGVNWSSRIPNTGFGIRGLFCTDINNCYVGGGDSTMTNGKIYKSTNSGLTWNLQLTDPNIFIGKIQFLDANTGFAGGSDGQSGTKVVLYKTTNGGGKK
ncbi:MAG: YCF48-related protein [Ignavibacteriae bacterium]|nr:YCF48-related protein [Ignavibacteriota bacterium]